LCAASIGKCFAVCAGKRAHPEYQKIGSWFRTEYGASTKTKKSKKVTFKEIFDKEELAPPRPVRPRVTHFYSARCYNERIKPRFDSRWVAVSKLANPPAPITVQNQVTKEAWDAESDPFKNEILAALENEHKAAVEAYEIAVSGEEPKTPEDFQM
jgi:hypothetical protein